MAKGPDNHEQGESQLSRKAREIKKQIDEGRYDIDLSALADALLDAGALDADGEPAHDSESGPPSGSSDLAQDDPKPWKE